MGHKYIIGVVGPCASGKSTLIASLKERGYQVKHIAQEHSYVPDMWRRLTNPELLVYLDVSYQVSLRRRFLNWTQPEYAQEIYRLRHARQHADLYIDTDQLTPDQVLDQVLRLVEG